VQAEQCRLIGVLSGCSDEVEPSTCTYELDADFRIVNVDAGWSQFAVANQAPELAPPGSLGESALSCVADSGTAHLYEQLFRKVMRTGQPITLPLRCDSPGRRRFLDLRIEPRTPSGLRVQTTLRRSEDRSVVSLLDRREPHAPELLHACSWCKAVEVDGRWLEVEDAIVALGLFSRERVPTITHGICPACYERIRRVLDAL
jgi:hypothetical protein